MKIVGVTVNQGVCRLLVATQLRIAKFRLPPRMLNRNVTIEW